ncbi:helix-turn-helix domain-containing protein [Streptomyces sp. AA1529]|uniref:helix-turn-helix domain-containing protein n=1 Tax=Streptomyces sp. AA1529 TaxID=1203257 RepID=UPI00037A89D9|nr:helix-turn-helix transcriptional regulator [Streptomyces sp. AA1529]
MGQRNRRAEDLPAAIATQGFGADVKRVRLARRLTQKQLGNATGYSEGYVSRVEAGKKSPSEKFAAGCDLAFGTGDLFSEQLRRILYGERVPEWFAPYVELEAKADRILDYSPVFPMGILQTEAYARAVFRAGPLAAKGEDTTPSLAARLDRKALLDRPTPPLLWVVLTESCLRTRVGGPALMQEQLGYLARLAQHPRVTLQVLPYRAGAYPCTTPFTLLRSGGWCAYSEFPVGGRSYDAQDFVTECMDLFDLIRARALGPDESVSFIQEISEDHRNG